MRKYEKAWDNERMVFVKPEDIPEVEMHDQYRYFSEKLDSPNDFKGFVLTTVKSSNNIRHKKDGTAYCVKSHFRKICENSREYATATEAKKKAQESNVHKLCKKVMRSLQFIHIPSYTARDIAGTSISIIPDTYSPIKVLGTEKKDADTCLIPDITVECELLGVKQEVLIEVVYKHELGADKRNAYKAFNKNCLYIDISDLQRKLDMSDSEIESEIRNRLDNDCKWVTNKLHSLIVNKVLPSRFIEINYENGVLQPTLSRNTDDLYKLYFAFQDSITMEFKKHKVDIDSSFPCYREPTISKAEKYITNIGDCKKCNHCLKILNGESIDKTSVNIYCCKDELTKDSLIEFKDSLIYDALKLVNTQ